MQRQTDTTMVSMMMMKKKKNSPLSFVVSVILVVVAAAFSLSVVVVVVVVDASIHEYGSGSGSADQFQSKGNAFVLYGGSEGIYSTSSTPPLVLNHNNNHTSSSSDEHGSSSSSFIRFENVTFLRPKQVAKSTSGLIHALIFEVQDRELIGGSAYGGQRAVCCTSDLAKLGLCKQGQIIIRRPSPTNANWPQLFGVSFIDRDLVATLPSLVIPITETGMYNLYFVHCDPNLKDIAIQGKTIWKNPTGYLPGRMAPLMSFYGFISLAFLMLGLFWFSQYARFWKEVLPLQNCITLVIVLGMLETALWYFEYALFNKSGIRHTGITVCAVTLGTVKRTVARVVILIVSMGYGVVRPTLGGLTSKVLTLGGTFLLASEALELVENVGVVNDLSGKARLFLVLPVAILDAFFIIWIFNSLSETLNKLQAKRMTAKLDIYRKFTNSLAVAVFLSVGWICYELYFKSNDVFNERWQSAWIIPAFWQVLSFSLLCVICALWAPSQNNTRYAYSDEGSEEFDNEDMLMLIKPSEAPSKDAWMAESNETSSNEDLEEDKTH